jgi:4-aminobutyrate aminotransferase-like enzyme
VLTAIPGPRSTELRRRETVHAAPGGQAISSYAGIAVASGAGAEIIDVDGNRFLDLSAGIGVAALGYGHPRYVAEVAEQLGKIHVGSFTSEARVRALEAISRFAPPAMDQVQLFSGGSEAVESAIRLARAHTGKSEVLSFWGGFHGKTAGALAQMGSAFKHGLGPLAPNAYLTPYADCARCPFGLTHPECKLACVDFARQKLEHETTGSLAAVLIEPMQGTAGNIVPPPDFLPAIAALAKERGALLIADEMITGFGRTGRSFAVDHFGVEPDILTIGKSLGGGVPVAGVLTTAAIARAEPWSRPSFSSSSYGGNPLASAAIAASLTIIREEDLPGRAERVGARLLSHLRDIALRHPSVQRVRGKGLFLGFDLVDPATGREWPADRCRRLFHALLERGVIALAYAPRVRLNPPLVLSPGEADEAAALLDDALSEVE